MNIYPGSFGLTSPEAYDHFICLSKKCKQRRAKRRKIRNERKKLKNQEKKAEIERIRSETKLMEQTLAPNARPSATMPLTRQAIASPRMISEGSIPKKAGLGDNMLVIIAGVLLIGGYVVMKKRTKQQTLNLMNQ